MNTIQITDRVMRFNKAIADWRLYCRSTYKVDPSRSMHVVFLKRYDEPESYGVHVIMPVQAWSNMAPNWVNMVFGLYSPEVMEALKMAWFDKDYDPPVSTIIPDAELQQLSDYLIRSVIPYEWKSRPDLAQMMAERIVTAPGFHGVTAS